MTVCQQMEIKCLGEGVCLLYKSTIWATSALVPSPCCPQVYELLMPEDLPQSPHVDPWKIVQGPWLWCAPPPSGSTPGGQQIPGPTPFLAEPPALALLLPFTEPLCIPTTTLPRPVPLHRHSQGPPSHMHFFSVLDFLLLPPPLPFFLPSFRKKKMYVYLLCACPYINRKSDHISPLLWAFRIYPGPLGSESCTFQGSPSTPVQFTHPMNIY